MKGMLNQVRVSRYETTWRREESEGMLKILISLFICFFNIFSVISGF